ncbi:hypothetical protein TrVGV298_005214 [Trichoderma virens]|nr:hypothetical protein TrVGV298_005214 [Trichoderma virens]
MAPARQQPPPPFGKDEKVLCFHMDMLYEAKIMDVQPAEKPNEGYRYKVHYKGWKNTWDDWVLVDRIRPFDDEHKELAAQLHAQLKNSMQKTSKVPKKIVKSGGESARGSEERGSAVTQGGRGGRRGKDWELEQRNNMPCKKRKSTRAQRKRPKKVDKSSQCPHCEHRREQANKGERASSPAAEEPSEPVRKRRRIILTRNGKPICPKKPAPGPALEPESQPARKRRFILTRNGKPICPRKPTPEPEPELGSEVEPETIPKPARKRRLILTRNGKPICAKKPPPEPVPEPRRKRRIIFTRNGKRICPERPAPEVVPEPIERPSEPESELEPEPGPEPVRKRIRVIFTRNGKRICPERPAPESVPDSVEPPSDSEPEPEDAFHSKPMINISVPDHIQAMLVDDWENITKNNQLVPLPHPNPVTKIFEDYLAVERPRREEGSSSMDILEEVIAGFREYFEKALSRILLYRFERHQYMDVRKLWDNADENSQYKNVCDVYGAEHLARLIVSLPELLAQTNMDQQSVSRLREEIGKFTTWLGRNCQSYFVNEYETPSQEYIDKARSF